MMATVAEPGAKPGRQIAWEAVAIAAVLSLAGIVRMGWPGLTEFKADEGRILTLALEAAAGNVPLHGLASSVGFPNAPMSVWIYALPLLIIRHPYAPTVFTGLLNTLSVAGVYWLARRYWGASAALAAALILATGPWAIIFSRKIWAQNLLPLFAVGWGISAALAFVEGRRPFLALHLVCLAVMAQIHPAAAGLAPATLLFLAIFRRRVDWRWLVAGGVLGALTAAPFVWYLWQRYTAGGLPFSTGQDAAVVSLDSLRLALAVGAGFGVEPLAGQNFALPLGAVLARWLWLGLVVGGIGWAVLAIARRRQEPSGQVALIALAWLLSPVMLFLWHRTPVYVHYFIAGLPAACLLAGAAFAGVAQRLPAWGKGLAWMALLVGAGLQLLGWGSLMRYVAAHPLESGFGVPLQAKLTAADTVRRLMLETSAAEALLIGGGADPETEDFPAEFRALLHDVDVRYVDINTEAVFPGRTSVALVDLLLADKATSTRDLYMGAATTTETVAVEPGNARAVYTVHTLPAAAAPSAEVELPAQPLLANFVRLTGHNAPRFGPQGMLWDVYWQTADHPDTADYHFFNHLVDDTGVRVAQADGAAFSGRQWRAGDTVVSRFLLPLAGDAKPPLTMRVGMYRYPSMENVPILDEAANPASDALSIPID